MLMIKWSLAPFALPHKSVFMKTWRRTAACVVAAALWSVSLGSAAAVAQDTAIKIATSTVPGVLGNPYATIGATTSSAWGVIFDTLTQFDADGRLQPGLAESWSQRDDRTWRFMLRDNVTFHNSVPLTADAIVRNIAYLLRADGQRFAIANELAGVESAKAIDRFTVDIITREPDAIFPARLNLIRIVEPDAWEVLGADGFAIAPVGSGPFQVEALNAGAGTLALAAVPHKWRPSISISKISMQVLPDQTSRLQALLSGQVDIAVGLGPDDIFTLERGGFNIYTRRRPEIMSLTFNLTSVGESPIQDVRVRRAMNYAVDKQGIVDGILLGYSEVGTAGVLSGTFGFDPGLKPFPYDPEKARALLAEAGYAEGFRLVADVITGQGPGDALIYQKAAQDLAAVGVRLDVRAVPYPSWVTKYFSGEWDDADAFSYVWTSSKFFDAIGAIEIGSCLKANPFFCDPSATAAIRASGEEMNVESRRTMLQSILGRLHTQTPALWLVGYRDLLGHAPHLTNVRARSMGLVYEDIVATTADTD